MNIHTQKPILGKPLRLLLCAALACAITSVTTQVIVSSAGQPEYGNGSAAHTVWQLSLAPVL
jgi:hypothetical protein